ncbi:MAG: hypothetical protein PHR94_14540 [Methylomonas lenta]|nr:hypothetical protein [Methylomonas lenta]
MPFPSASRNTAFLTGLSLSAPTYLFYILQASELSTYDLDHPRVFAGIVIVDLLSLLVFVIDIRSLAPTALKTSIPLVYFPINQAGWNYLLRLLGRFLVWLLDIATGVGLLAALQYLLKLF